MAKRIEGVTEKLLECAKEEFLANGYENTSLRIIAEKAGYTKGVIYIRYPDKENFDIFKILLMSGETKVYQEFLHRLVEIDTDCTTKFIEQTNNDAFSSGRLTPELAHILSYAFYSGLFEIVIHNMPQERASEHIGKLRKFYNTGWKTIFEGDEAEQVNGERGSVS